jgi:hypothetical protein
MKWLNESFERICLMNTRQNQTNVKLKKRVIMKKLAIVATAVFFLAGFSANAQMHQGKMMKSGQQHGMMMHGKGMMHGGMMKGMMCPMHKGMMGQQMPMKRYMMAVNMLPNMQEKLSLSQDQTEKLIDMQAAFKKQQVDYKADLTKKRMKLQNLMKNDASADEIKSQMQACSETKISMKVAAYETANQMKSVLSDEQQEQLDNMMMQHPGMQQGGMMKGGMMQGGMMKGGMMQGGMNQGNMMKNNKQQ